MSSIDVDGLRFTFPDDWRVTKFDEWPAYRRAASFGFAACDLVAVHHRTLYVIEAKDYTYPDRVQGAPADLPDTVSRKALHTIGLLWAWSRDGSPVQVGQHDDLLHAAVACDSIEVCLHVELKDGGRGAMSLEKPLADLTDQLSRRTKSFAEGKPIVSTHHVPGRAAWTAARLPANATTASRPLTDRPTRATHSTDRLRPGLLVPWHLMRWSRAVTRWRRPVDRRPRPKTTAGHHRAVVHRPPLSADRALTVTGSLRANQRASSTHRKGGSP